MSFAYFPLYSGDYLRKTRGLTLTEHGAYVMLLLHCWDTGDPLPNDFPEISNIAGARSESECATVEKIVRRFFRQNADGTWFNHRLEKELDRTNVIASHRSAAGARGAAARWQKKANGKQAHSKSIANATPHPHPHPHPHPKELPSVESKEGSGEGRVNGRRATRLLPTADLPEDWIIIARAAHPDWSDQGIYREFITFRDYWTAKSGPNATKLDWKATWRTWIRRADAEPKR